MTTATSTPIPRPQKVNLLQGFTYTGTREQITAQLHAAKFPKAWGPSHIVASFAQWHIPSGPGWNGYVRVTGYRTDPNEMGTGTVYVSVTWGIGK